MESRPHLPLSEYWYPGALDRTIDATLRAACTLAWPYALYCATRFHRDVHVAHELMDEALPKAEQYILRSGRERELKQVCYCLLSLAKRLSRQRLRHAELPAGLLSDLEQITHQLGTSTPQEASAYLNQLLSRMSPKRGRPSIGARPAIASVRSRKSSILTTLQSSGHTTVSFGSWSIPQLPACLPNRTKTTASGTKFDVEDWFLSLLRKERQIRAEAPPTPECVTEAFLASYARHPDHMSLSDLRVKHVIDCDHCLPKLFDLRSQNAARSRSTVRYGLTAAACTACLLVGFILAHVVPWRAVRPKSRAVASLSLDLRSYGTYRGSSQDDEAPLLLPPARVDLTLILPPFSESGLYSISIARDREGHQSVAYARAIAVVENQQTRLTVPLDFSAASPGDYVLSTEREGDGGAYYYPLRVH